MDFDDYLRDQASMYRALAGETDDQDARQELRELAAICEEVANEIEDRHTGG